MSRAYVTLDGLRGAAALSIVVLHAHRYLGDMTWSSAALAVDMFFVLSGFVMAYAYGDRLKAGMTPFEFVKLRLIRFYPLYLLGIGLGVIEAVATIQTGAGSLEWSWDKLAWSLPFNLLMLPAVGGSALFPLNGVMWSIFFELLINIVWIGFWRPLENNRLLVAVIVLSGLGLIVSTLYWNTFFGLGVSWTTFVGGCFRVSYSFFLGLLFYRLHKGLALPIFPSSLLIGGLLVVLFLPLPKPFGHLAAAMFLVPWFVLLGSRSRPAKLLSPIFIALGAASYALYVVHVRLYRITYGGFLAVGIDLQPYAPWVGVVFILVTIALSLCLEYYFHNPIRKWLSGHARTRIERPARVP